MKRRIGGIAAFVVICSFLSGCSDNRYLSERMLYMTEKKVAQILKDRSATAPLTEKDYDQVIGLYKKIAERFPFEPVSAQIHATIANIYIAQKKYDDAHQELKVIIQNFSRQPQVAANAQFAIARLFEIQGKYAQAVAEYEKIKELYPLTQLGMEIPLFLTNYYEKSKNQEKEDRAYRSALRHYKRLVDDYTGTSQEAYFQDYLVRTYVQGNEIDKAVEVLDEMSSKFKETPAGVRAVMSKAEIYAGKMKDFTKAIGTYQEFIDKNPKSEYTKEFRYRVGDLYFLGGQPEKAFAAFTALLKDYPEDKNIALKSHFGLAACYMKQGVSDKVFQEYEYIKKNFPDSPAALSVPYLTYRYYLQLKDTANAEVALIKAISEYESNFRASQGQERLMTARFLFVCYAAKKDWDKAIKLMRALSRQNPQDPGFLLSIAAIYSRVLNSPKEAIGVYEEILEKYPSQKKLVERVQKEIVQLKNSPVSGKSN